MRRSVPLIVVVLATTGCDSDVFSPEEDVPASERGALPLGATSEPVLPAAAEVPCVDEQIAQLSLTDVPASGGITPLEATAGYESAIDATAGGFGGSEGFVYARFTESGLEKLELDDESAFESTAWHIAFRRYVIRLNGGVSGPGMVLAAATPPDTRFETLQRVPSDLRLLAEQYYTPSCTLVADDSGIGAPATLLSSFWSYTACLTMTGNVFVLALPDGRHIKLQVRAYYTLDNQQRCDETGATGQPSGAGNLRIRWDYLAPV